MSASWLTQNFADEDESDNDFNPGAVNEEGSDNEDEPRQQQQANNRRPDDAKRRQPTKVDVDEDEDEGDGEGLGQNGRADEEEDEDEDEDDEDEDEDDEDEDEDAVRSRPRKRRRRNRLNPFFEEEAEVDEDDDEAEAEEDEIGQEFIQDTHPDDDLPPEADTDDRRHRELDRQRQLEASMDAEKQAAALKERYGRRTTTALSGGAIVPQNLLMPSVDDPGIWGIKCKPGKEKDIVGRVMKKFIESLTSRNPMRICSVFERGAGSMAGYIFVEARNKADVDHALDGVPDVYPRTRTIVVPIKEMPDLLRVTKDKELERGGYVRIRKGLYADDLGMIEDVVSNGLEVTVRLVPRLDYGLNDDDARGAANNPNAGNKRNRINAFGQVTTPRPPQRLFNENEAKKRHGKFLAANRGLTGSSWIYKNEQYEDGFLIKDFKLQQLITEKINPKLDEITKLTKTDAEGAETLDLETLKHSIVNDAEGTFVPGDDVEVYEGEQRGIVGKTEAVSGNIVSIKISEGELTGQIVEVPVKGIRKRFREGDHVKVIGNSRYRDEVGMILRIKADRVTLLTDTSGQEITVFSKDLREAADSGGGLAGGSKFDVQDLIQLDATTVGIVIRADRESVRILDQNSSVTTRLPSQIQKLETRKNAVATDKNGSEIRAGDVVRESGGESKTGTILHIHRGFIFAHNKTQIENSGLWVARCMNVITTAAKGGRITAPSTDLSKMNPALLAQNGGPRPMAPPQRPGRDKLQGQQVHIRKGPYKGHRGIAKDTTSQVARIELQSKNKIVNVDKQDLMVIERGSGKMIDYNMFMGSRGPPPGRTGGVPGSRIPDGGFGGRTPLPLGDGGRTPAWGAGSRTPAWGGAGSSSDSGKTPAWKGASGSQTAYGGAGNTTSYGGMGNYGTSGGGRTPAWSSNSKTPYGADHGFGSSNSNSAFDAFASGSRTPAYGSSSSRTPAWGGPSNGASAPTPAAQPYDAATPAVSAPTPGAFNDDAYTPYGAPTPGGALNAPTPGGNAQTPYGGYDAPTPAAGGPRYAEDDDD